MTFGTRKTFVYTIVSILLQRCGFSAQSREQPTYRTHSLTYTVHCSNLAGDIMAVARMTFHSEVKLLVQRSDLECMFEHLWVEMPVGF
jgi:hypothetical protein